MNRAHGIVDFDMGLAAELFYRLGRGLDVSKIIGRLENAKHVHTVGDGSFDELPNDFVGVGPVGQNVLAAQQHLQFRLRHHRLDAPQPIPWIFFKVAHAHVERRAAPNFHGVKAAIIDGRAQRQQIVRGNPGRQLALLPVPRREVGYFYPAAPHGFGEQFVHVRGQLI